MSSLPTGTDDDTAQVLPMSTQTATKKLEKKLGRDPTTGEVQAYITKRMKKETKKQSVAQNAAHTAVAMASSNPRLMGTPQAASSPHTASESSSAEQGGGFTWSEPIKSVRALPQKTQRIILGVRCTIARTIVPWSLLELSRVTRWHGELDA